MSVIAWGDAPTWVASLGTVGAVWLALSQSRGARDQAAEAHRLGLAALQLSQEEGERRRLERADEEAHQARQIVSHITNACPTSFVHITNTSDEPIGSVVLEAAYLDNLVAPASWTFAPGPGSRVAVLKAHDTVTVPIEFRNDQGELLELGQTRAATADISFVDSRGVRWRRWALVQPRLAPDAAVQRAPTFEPRQHLFGSAMGTAEGSVDT